jgi:polyphosphate kinase
VPTVDATASPLLNRELSWLDLNERVLDLAADADEPLLERIKFCAIFSDELRRVLHGRIAGLLDQIAANVPRPARPTAGRRRPRSRSPRPGRPRS